MYEIAKKAREKMKAKARSLAGEKDQKTDSSDWSPAEPLNADAKTGMRPISPRNFKKGGKVVGNVDGAVSKPRADRKARKSGGRVESEIGVGMANKNMKEANQSREGVKHIGGLKKGGKVARKDGGNVPSDKETMTNKDRIGTEKIKPVRGAAQHYKKGGRSKKADGGFLENLGNALAGRGYIDGSTWLKKDEPVAEKKASVSAPLDITPVLHRAARPAPAKRPLVKYTPTDEDREMMNPVPIGRRANALTAAGSEPISGWAQMKKGGKVRKRADGGQLPSPEEALGSEVRMKGLKVMPSQANSAAAEVTPAQLKREEGYTRADMKAKRKSGGRTKKMDGGVMVAPVNVPRGRMSFGQNVVTPGLKKGGKAEGGEKWIQKAIEKPGALRKSLGVKEGEKIPAKKLHEAAEKGGKLGKRARLAETLGRMNRATGGRTGKGKTNINIVIAPGQRAPQAGMTGPGAPPPAGLPGSPGGPIPVPAPAPGAGAPPVMPPQMPMPAPAGAPPMMRKSGGRISKVAKSYKDMTAGSGSGEGRLQKTDIAKLHKDAPARKSGGRAKSYKDMTAGAGSGEGRMQKTEIEKSQRLRGK